MVLLAELLIHARQAPSFTTEFYAALVGNSASRAFDFGGELTRVSVTVEQNAYASAGNPKGAGIERPRCPVSGSNGNLRFETIMEIRADGNHSAVLFELGARNITKVVNPSRVVHQRRRMRSEQDHVQVRVVASLSSGEGTNDHQRANILPRLGPGHETREKSLSSNDVVRHRSVA
jgi:hypothetical protein